MVEQMSACVPGVRRSRIAYGGTHLARVLGWVLEAKVPTGQRARRVACLAGPTSQVWRPQSMRSARKFYRNVLAQTPANECSEAGKPRGSVVVPTCGRPLDGAPVIRLRFRRSRHADRNFRFTQRVRG